MAFDPVIKNVSYTLVHAPELVRYGSKPRREIVAGPSFQAELERALRSFDAICAYPPNQTYIGNISPDELARIPRPWYAATGEMERPPGAMGRFGEIVSQELFYAVLKAADVLVPSLVALSEEAGERLRSMLHNHGVLSDLADQDWHTTSVSEIEAEIDAGSGIALKLGGELLGCMRRDTRAEGRDDPNLDAHTLLEALCSKASAAIALRRLLEREGIGAERIDYVISCGEEAAGDRYQRGGGGMAKAVGEMCGCINASGMDIKNFCAASASALMTAGALIKAGLFETIAVVAGGSLAKLGMKSVAFLRHGMPVLDDCLAAHAFLVTRDDGVSPRLHLEPGAIGIARIGSSTSDEAVYRQLILEPLQALGWKMSDIDKYAPELHNPEIMEHSGSGDVVHKNYRMIAATAVRAGEFGKADMDAFIERVGMVGFAPTQGHIPSGVPFIGHAMDAMAAGDLERVMFLCKASLFLNRMTGLFDGVSFILEANPSRDTVG